MSDFISVRFKGKSVKIPVRRTGLVRKGTGLTFRTKDTCNLLFEFGRPRRWSITSWFVFFDFLAIWLDGNNNVLEWQIVKPFVFRIRPQKKFKRVVEVPLNSKNGKIIDFFVGKGRKV